jgi:RDD family protein
MEFALTLTLSRKRERASWENGAVTVEDSVASPASLSGDLLRTSFLPSIATVTLGLIRMRGRSLCLGPIPLHTFGPPKMSSTSVSWPIEGGLLTAEAGGRFTIESAGGELKATVEGYRPMLPRAVYEATQLRLHHSLVRLQLLRLAGTPPPPNQASRTSRLAAAAIDTAVCAGIALVMARRRPVGAFARIAVGYHLACWTTSGQTIGGRVMHQRVVATDGSRLSLVQSALRLAALPIAALRRYPAHDDIAATTVVEDPT